jgi:hypothetical protein
MQFFQLVDHLAADYAAEAVALLVNIDGHTGGQVYLLK